MRRPPPVHTGGVDVVALVIASYVLGSVLLTCVLLTGLSAFRRGSTMLPAVLAGAFFPLAWTLWFVVDERPVPHAGRIAA